MCTYQGEPRVPTGESPVYLLERAPCTYRGEPRVPTGETPVYLLERPRVPTGEKLSSNLLFQKGFQAHRL